MIFTERNITIRNDNATINAPVILYRGDKNVEVRFTLVESPYKYTNRDSVNIIESTDAAYAQLIIKTPNDRDPIFGDITAVGQSNIIFVIEYGMIDEIGEVGEYDFQIRLFDSDQTSMVTLPEVVSGFIIKEPIAKENATNNITNSAIVDSAVVTNDTGIPTFVSGSYNKTTWSDGDVISKQKLNKLEDSIYETYELSKVNNSQINKKANQSDLAVEKARIDNFTKLAEGSTTGDAELIDGRIGIDGTTYDNIGSAIRSQIANTNAITKGGIISQKFSNGNLYSGFCNSNNEVNSVPDYKYSYIELDNKAYLANVVSTNLSDTIIINTLDSEKNLIANIVSWGNLNKYEIPMNDNVKYLCISCKDVDKDKITINQTIRGIANTVNDVINDLDTINKNIAVVPKLNSIIFNNKLSTLLSEEEVINGSRVDSNNTIYNDPLYSYCFVDIEGVDTITIKTDGVPLSSASVYAFFADKDKKFLKILLVWSDLTEDIVINRNEIWDNAKYISFSCHTEHFNKIHIIKTYKDSPICITSKLKKDNNYLIEKSKKYDSALAHIRTREDNKFIKALHLDCGRKYFSVANIKRLLDACESAKLNTFQIYFSDTKGFRFALNDMNINVYGDNYDLSTAVEVLCGKGDGSNKYLTESEMDDIIMYANNKGIEVIPAFDMPGHFGIVNVFDKIAPVTEYGRIAMVEILKKYASYFASKGCRYYNICGDESGYSNDIFEEFMYMAMSEIASLGMTPMIYNDKVCSDGYMKPYINTGATVLCWNNTNDPTCASYSTIQKSGYKLLNSSGKYYWTLGQTTTTTSHINEIKNSNIFKLSDNSISYDITGVIYSIWCDKADADGDDEGNNVVNQTLPYIEAFGYAVNKAVPSDELITIKSPNGTVFRLDVNNEGVLSAVQLPNN